MAHALRALNGTSPRPKEGLTGLLSTHPSLEERLAALGEPPAPHPTLSPEGRGTEGEGRGVAASAKANHPRP